MLGDLIASIARAGVRLPRLALADFLVAGAEGCASASLASRVTGLARSDAPEILLARTRGGSLGELTVEERADQLARLGREARALAAITARDQLRVLHRALLRDLPREQRRDALRRCAR